MRLGYIIIYVPDVSAAADFYEAAFGLHRRFVHESGYAEMETGGTALAFATEALARSNGVAFRDNRAGDSLAAGRDRACMRRCRRGRHSRNRSRSHRSQAADAEALGGKPLPTSAI